MDRCWNRMLFPCCLLLLLLCRSAWVERSRPSVLICLSVCPQHNSKMNDPKVFKLYIGNELGYTRSDMFFGLEGQRSRSQVQ